MGLTIAPNFTQRLIRWTDFKAQYHKRNFAIQMQEDADAYHIYGYDGSELFYCAIHKSSVPQETIDAEYHQATNDADKAEFVASYLSRANTKIECTECQTYYEIKPLLNGANANMNVNASLGSPQTFRWTPSGQIYQLEDLSIVINDQGDFSLSVFGSLGAALANGLIVRGKTKGQLFTICTLKDNADVFGIFGENPYGQSLAVLLQANSNTYAGRLKFAGQIALDPILGDYIEVVAQDNLTGLLKLQVYAKVWRIP